MVNHTQKGFKVVNGVDKRYLEPIRVRFEVVLKEYGKKWSEVYKQVGLSKSYASHILNGTLIPPKPLRVKISKTIGCDSTSIWEFPILITSDKMEGDVKDLKHNSSHSNIQDKGEEDGRTN